MEEDNLTQAELDEFATSEQQLEWAHSQDVQIL
jgi:hypothetical protein